MGLPFSRMSRASAVSTLIMIPFFIEFGPDRPWKIPQRCIVITMMILDLDEYIRPDHIEYIRARCQEGAPLERNDDRVECSALGYRFSFAEHSESEYGKPSLADFSISILAFIGSGGADWGISNTSLRSVDCTSNTRGPKRNRRNRRLGEEHL
ncbi:hypothetical protein N7520_000282 [Penicillium odoratum]|uniref:uncharacterized protein n=1 Tax=Penicillium odoratum TaxID=1167516 RepID=UPI002546C5D0|nr:uncharacterized protein N7520_000282 [Penicillium odoratum]KAJ5777036.1 hypothetical protein N7520_000282 [Penicillium odoratum]